MKYAVRRSNWTHRGRLGSGCGCYALSAMPKGYTLTLRLLLIRLTQKLRAQILSTRWSEPSVFRALYRREQR
jgi:hypothetical protein